VRTVGIYLGGTPSDGGTYQNALSLVASLARLPRDAWGVIGYWVQPEWAAVCERHGLVSRPVIAPSAPARAVAKAARELPIGVRARKAIGSAIMPFGRQLRTDGVDVCIYPNFEQYAWELATPGIGAIHDLMHRYEPHFPEVASGDIARKRDVMLSRMRRGATAVLTDSDTGSDQVRESYGERGARLFPLPYVSPAYIYEAAGVPDDPGVDAWAREMGLPDHYFFYPAQFWTHKNHVRLLRALVRVAATHDDVRLVLVGSEKNGSTAVTDEIARLGLAERVSVLGYVSSEQLVYLYRHARALVMPTFFGPTNIPPLEAFVLGCPVAVSGIYGMPEQLGDAALYFDPGSEDEIAEACARLWEDAELRDKLRERGYARAAEWGPEQHAVRLREILEAVTGPGADDVVR
jgi:glycosyltransferase involved in cell wall biosynthesis